MHYKITQREDIAEAFIPMTEIQEHTRSYDPHDEELLSVYRLAAISFAETYMNRVLGICKVKATIENYQSRVYLPLGDVQSVQSVSVDGVDIPYKVNMISNEVMLGVSNHRLKDFVFDYTVGYEVDQIPPVIKLGILKLIATWFESREDVSFGVAATEVPFNNRACFDLYRIPVGG